MVRGRLAGGVGRARVVAGLLGEAACIGQRAIDFIGRDMVEAKIPSARAAFAPMGECRLEQDIAADHIGVDEFGRAVDRAVDMAFGCQMHDRVGLKPREGVGDGGAITDIAAAEMVAGIAVERGERRQIARIGQLVEDEHLVLRILDEMPDDG